MKGGKLTSRKWCYQTPDMSHDVELSYQQPVDEDEFRDDVRKRLGVSRLPNGTRIMTVEQSNPNHDGRYNSSNHNVYYDSHHDPYYHSRC